MVRSPVLTTAELGTVSALRPGAENRTVAYIPGFNRPPGLGITTRAFSVRASAVVRTGERALVFVDMGGGSLMAHEVELGRVSGDLAEVLSGVEPGQRVVTSAQFLLESESNVAEAMRGMIGMTGSSDMSGMEGMDMTGADMRGMDMPREER